VEEIKGRKVRMQRKKEGRKAGKCVPQERRNEGR